MDEIHICLEKAILYTKTSNLIDSSIKIQVLKSLIIISQTYKFEDLTLLSISSLVETLVKYNQIGFDDCHNIYISLKSSIDKTTVKPMREVLISKSVELLNDKLLSILNVFNNTENKTIASFTDLRDELEWELAKGKEICNSLYTEKIDKIIKETEVALGIIDHINSNTQKYNSLPPKKNILISIGIVLLPIYFTYITSIGAYLNFKANSSGGSFIVVIGFVIITIFMYVWAYNDVIKAIIYCKKNKINYFTLNNERNTLLEKINNYTKKLHIVEHNLSRAPNNLITEKTQQKVSHGLPKQHGNL
jgi:hypothetical protein